MAYYYSSASQQNTNGSANTDLILHGMWTAAAGARAAIQKLVAGSYATPADNAIRLRLVHLTAGTVTAGSGLTPAPTVADAPAANAGSQTLPTVTSPTIGNPLVQLAFNQRGTAMWAAFNPDEVVTMVGAGSNTAINNLSIFLYSQSTGTTIPVNYKILHSE